MIIPCMGMVLGVVWALVVRYLIRQRTRVRLRELEVRELELGVQRRQLEGD